MSTLEAAPSKVAALRTPHWVPRARDETAEAALARAMGLSHLFSRLLVARGIRTANEAERFLNPDLDQLHDPYLMSGMEAAVERIERAIRGRELILIYGDYDVDGTLAVVLLKTAIERLGGRVTFHVPHRLREGYGMQSEVIAVAAHAGVKLIISVDTGIRDHLPAEAAESLGVDLIITDHHLPEASDGPAAPTLPFAAAILNPNQPGCRYPCKHLCGTGVAFKIVQALVEAHDPVETRARLLSSFVKLVAIATVADSVPLLDENRVFVALGLKQLAHVVNPGLRALLAVAELDPARHPLTPVDLGFRLGPRINAAGRMDVATEVVELFTTRDPERARSIARELDHLNTERRTTETATLGQILARLGRPEFERPRCLVIDGEGWHRGVLGIVASRVVERTGKPTLIVTHEDGQAYGSGRSIPGFHLLDAIETCRDLFTRYGGHAHAAGFSLPSGKVPELRARLFAYAEANLAESDLGSPVEYDAALPLEEIDEALFGELRRLEPCGVGNVEPIFTARSLRVASTPRVMKGKHIRLELAFGNGAARMAAVGWNRAERAAALGLGPGSLLDIAYKVRRNDHTGFGGLELEIVSLRTGVKGGEETGDNPH